MSRRGNNLDNAVIENFFGTIKYELFYLNKYESFTHLNKEINEYIKCYNKNRSKPNLNGMSPIQLSSSSL